MTTTVRLDENLEFKLNNLDYPKILCIKKRVILLEKQLNNM